MMDRTKLQGEKRDMTESQLERRLTRGVKTLGGRAYKFVSPGNAGMPDRLVILPGGRVLFVELKTASGRLSVRQRLKIQELRCLGANVRPLFGADEVDEFLQLCKVYVEVK